MVLTPTRVAQSPSFHSVSSTYLQVIFHVLLLFVALIALFCSFHRCLCLFYFLFLFSSLCLPHTFYLSPNCRALYSFPPGCLATCPQTNQTALSHASPDHLNANQHEPWLGWGLHDAWPGKHTAQQHYPCKGTDEQQQQQLLLILGMKLSTQTNPNAG